MKIFKIQKTELTNTGYTVSGIVGKTEYGDDIAHAQYYGSGGIQHFPSPNEQVLMQQASLGRFNIAFGNKTYAVELEEGETALFSLKNGSLQASLIAKQNGELHLNGHTHSAVLFEPLKSFLEKELQNWLNTHTHPTPSGPSGTATNPFFSNIENAKSSSVRLS